uniref:Pho cyclin Clg1 n=1 Tax=Blastocladiella emersonii TaxID=4808 RepID=A0A238HJR0_BLAEM|nr:Pho cyclin Clg1 [Blastocladiella emersonii]
MATMHSVDHMASMTNMSLGRPTGAKTPSSSTGGGAGEPMDVVVNDHDDDAATAEAKAAKHMATPAASPPSNEVPRPRANLHHATPSTLDFHASLLAAVALYLWSKRPLPTTPVQCAACHALPLTALLKHLLVTTKLPLEQFYLALKFIQVLVSSYPELTVVSKPGSEIRVMIASIILTNKLMEDNYISKRSWARVSSLSLQELNRMELEILDGLHWNLEVSTKEYSAWITWLSDLRRAPSSPVSRPVNLSSSVAAQQQQQSAASLNRDRLRHQDSALSLSIEWM